MERNDYIKLLVKNLPKGNKWLVTHLPTNREGLLTYEILIGVLILKLLEKVKYQELQGEPDVIKVIFRQARDARAEHYKSNLYKKENLLVNLDIVNENEISINSSLENKDIIHKILNSLTHEEVELISLRFLYDLTFKQIADLLKINEDAAKQRVQRLKSSIKSKFTKL